jgi:hypothetical protein
MQEMQRTMISSRIHCLFAGTRKAMCPTHHDADRTDCDLAWAKFDTSVGRPWWSNEHVYSSIIELHAAKPARGKMARATRARGSAESCRNSAPVTLCQVPRRGWPPSPARCSLQYRYIEKTGEAQ